MRVKCSLCEVIDNLNDDAPLAKKLRNRPIHTYLCSDCHKRISERTEDRINSGKFKQYRSKSNKDELLH